MGINAIIITEKVKEKRMKDNISKGNCLIDIVKRVWYLNQLGETQIENISNDHSKKYF